MKSYIVLSILGAAITPVFAKGNLPAVSVKGNAFFTGNDRFYIRGVAYQPGSLQRATRCARRRTDSN